MLVALDRITGRELWRLQLPTPRVGTAVNGQPARAEGLVIVGVVGGYFYGVDRATGRLAWTYAPPSETGGTSAGPFVFGDVMYGDAGGGSLLALRAVDGSVLWRTRLQNRTSEDLLVTSNRVYVPEDDHLDVLDRLTGQYVARRRQPPLPNSSGGLIATPPAASGGRIFVGVVAGVWAFDEP